MAFNTQNMFYKKNLYFIYISQTFLQEKRLFLPKPKPAGPRGRVQTWDPHDNTLRCIATQPGSYPANWKQDY